MLQISIVPVTDFQQNCSIVFDDQTKNGVVVDPGGDLDRVIAKTVELGVTVEAIWLTHGHLDHAGAAEAAKAHFKVDIVGPHVADKMLLDNIVLAATQYGITGFANASLTAGLSRATSSRSASMNLKSATVLVTRQVMWFLLTTPTKSS